MKRSHCIQNQLANVKSLVGEYDMNESSRQLSDLGPMSRQVDGVGKQSSKQPCWLGEVNNQNIRWNKVRSQ